MLKGTYGKIFLKLYNVGNLLSEGWGQSQMPGSFLSRSSIPVLMTMDSTSLSDSMLADTSMKFWKTGSCGHYAWVCNLISSGFGNHGVGKWSLTLLLPLNLRIDDMNLDDPKKPEFATWNRYTWFAQEVRRSARFVWNENVHAFLDTVSATLNTRDVKIPKGNIFYRAQQGIRYLDTTDMDDNIIEGVLPAALKPERMKPL